MLNVHAIAAALLAASLPPTLGAGGYSEIVAFGDSLSDGGNVNVISFGFTPNCDYHQSRSFSNGPVWVEVLAPALGVTVPVPSLTGGGDATNYAYGGAESGDGLSNPIDPFPLDLPNVGCQIDDFIAAGRTLSPSTLVTLWIGGNCLIAVPAGSQPAAAAAVTTLVENIKIHINELISLGAKSLVVPNLPALGNLPRLNSPRETKIFFNAMTADYNAQHAGLMAQLRAANPGVRIFSPDIAELLEEILSNPGTSGFTNTTDVAYVPGFGGTSFGSMTVPNPDQYLYWDDIHPSGPVHNLLGQLVAQLVSDRAPVPITRFGSASAGFELSFQSFGSDCYRIEWSPNLAGWTTLQDNVVGDGTILDFLLPRPPGSRTGFFRVVTRP